MSDPVMFVVVMLGSMGFAVATGSVVGVSLAVRRVEAVGIDLGNGTIFAKYREILRLESELEPTCLSCGCHRDGATCENALPDKETP